MQALHPGALAGVMQHSRYEQDALGRLAGTTQWLTVVTFGDTLYSIARDSEVTLEALVAANSTLLGGNPNAILQVGWQLRLPGCAGEEEEPVAEGTPSVTPAGTPSGPVVHIVQAGEGIYSIARKYGVTYEAIVAANNLANPNLIYPGQELIIPSGQ